MRAAGARYLPKETREDDTDWQNRLSAATLLPALKRTVRVMTGKPFSKALTLSEDVPEPIKQGFADCDMQGNNLHSFASEVMDDALAFGISGVLVDFPRTGETVKTLSDERKLGVRPYFVHIKHHQILGWKAEKQDGALTLTMLRVAQSVEVPDGEYGSKMVGQVLLLKPGAFQLFQETKDGYVVIDEGVTTLKAIPFVPFYGKKLAFMQGVSPLLDLAYLNEKHWKHQSTQDEGVSFARRRLVVFIGAEDAATVTVSSSHGLNMPAGGDVKVIQGSAESVSIGRSELQALEQHMIMTGAELLQPRDVTQKSATQSVSEDEANKCELQRITEQFEDGLDMLLAFQCQWLGIPYAGNITLFKDFAAGMQSDASAQLVLTMSDGGHITKKRALLEMQRRGILSADLDPDTELNDVEAQGVPLGVL